jgi:hypothetical protein
MSFLIEPRAGIAVIVNYTFRGASPYVLSAVMETNGFPVGGIFSKFVHPTIKDNTGKDQ